VYKGKQWSCPHKCHRYVHNQPGKPIQGKSENKLAAGHFTASVEFLPIPNLVWPGHSQLNSERGINFSWKHKLGAGIKDHQLELG